jgi:hypothetical protein
VPADLWDQLTARQTVPSSGVALWTAAAALALLVIPGVWPVVRNVVTVAHEGGHALVAVLAGRRLAGVRLHSDTSGLTVSRGRPRGPGMVVTLLAGYPMPGLVGLAAAAALAAGRPLLVLWGVLLVLALLLLQIRNLFGLWVVLVCGAVAVAVTGWTQAPVQSAVACGLAWFLLLAAPRAVVELAASRRGGRGRGSDADQLAKLTHLPGAVWVLVFGLVTVVAAGVGARLLLPDLLG